MKSLLSISTNFTEFKLKDDAYVKKYEKESQKHIPNFYL